MHFSRSNNRLKVAKRCLNFGQPLPSLLMIFAAVTEEQPQSGEQMAQRPVRETLADTVAPAHTALLVIDVQNDLVMPSYDPMVGRLAHLLAAAREAGVFIVYVQNSVLPNLSNSPSEIARRKKVGLKADVTLFGSEGELFVPKVAPMQGEVVVRKHRLNAFEGTNLEMLLTFREIETVICTGVATHGCVTATSYAAQSLSHYVVVVEDCVASWQTDLHDAALHVLRHTMNHVTAADTLLQCWNCPVSDTEARRPQYA
jgi:nicotinamidase-related amidase